MATRDWEVEDFDLFVSYARRDNASGMITALVDRIRADFARFAPTSRLSVFFDRDDIRDLHDWQERLRQGLERSKVMLAVLSPNYFASEWCRREWEAWVRIEQGRTYPGESIAPMFVVSPGELESGLGDRQRGWWDDLRCRQGIEAQEWWPHGRAALERLEVAERLERMERAVVERAEFGRRLARVPRNLRRRNPHFTGRVSELRAVRDALSRFETAGLCAIHGLGGIGKSSVAREYAWRFRPEYLGGQFEIDLSAARTTGEVRARLIGLARDHLGADIPFELEPDAAFQRARAAFERRGPDARVLLLLDNLDEDDAAMVSERERAAWMPVSENVHVVLTTRVGPGRLGRIPVVSIDALSAEDALELFGRYRAVAVATDSGGHAAGSVESGRNRPHPEVDSGEWKAALSIVNRLGRHTLAVELVAAFLGRHRDIGLKAFLDDLDQYDIGVALDAVGRDDRVRQLVEHPETLIGPLFSRTLAGLGVVARRVLELAALLPPDVVPIPWIEAICRSDPALADALVRRPFRPEPFEAALRDLDDLRLLTRAGDAPIGRIHRVVQSVAREGLDEARTARDEDALRDQAEARGEALGELDVLTPSRWEATALDRFATGRWSDADRRVANAAVGAAVCHSQLGDIEASGRLLMLAEATLERLLNASPDDFDLRLRIASCLSWRSACAVRGGDLREALVHAERHLEFARRAADKAPESDDVVRMVRDACEDVGDILTRRGAFREARPMIEEALSLTERLVRSQETPSGKAVLRLGLLHVRRGEALAGDGDVEEARRSFETGVALLREQATDGEAGGAARRLLSASLVRQGDMLFRLEEYSQARRAYEESLEITRSRVAADPENCLEQRELSARLTRLSEVALVEGDREAARRMAREVLEINRRKSEVDTQNFLAQDDLWTACRTFENAWGDTGDSDEMRACRELRVVAMQNLDRLMPGNPEVENDLAEALAALGNLELRQRELPQAAARFEAAAAIRKRQLAAAPDSPAARCDLSVVYERLGATRWARGDLAGAIAMGLSARELMLEPVAAEPFHFNSVWNLRIISATLAATHRDTGKPADAVRFRQEAAEASRRLTAACPDRADLRFDLAGDLAAWAYAEQGLGRLETARDLFRESAAVLESLDERRGVLDVRTRLAEIAESFGDQSDAAAEYERALVRLQMLAARRADERHHDDPDLRRDIARSRELLALSRIRAGETEAARCRIDEGVAAARADLHASPGCPIARHALSSMLAVDSYFARQRNDHVRELRSLRECVEIAGGLRSEGVRLSEEGGDEDSVWNGMIERLAELESSEPPRPAEDSDGT